NAIIRFVNRFIPEANLIVATPAKPASSAIDPKIMAVIVSAVKIVTAGKGNVVKIEREKK
ncbi:MAG: hypothetical protein JW798_04115, partial [Prolixibacteraceae bacterium]|nr:hypothetical protein [Prolixibacteraceae bacterium]